jgi:DNA-binding response OmpR family regulator
MVMTKRILVVDDERDVTELTQTFLSFHNLEVDSVNDPTQVERMLKAHEYDLIIIDLMMPKLSGFDVIRQIKKEPSLNKVPIIVVSAKTLSDEERKFLLQTKTEYIMKPYEPQNLVEQIQKTLSASKK